MQPKHGAGLIASAAIFVVLLVTYAHFARRGHHRAAVIRDAGVLTQLRADWTRYGRPTGSALASLLSEYGRNRPFVFTNVVQVGGTNYGCMFAISDERFAEPGMVAITTQGLVLWTGSTANYIVRGTRQ